MKKKKHKILIISSILPIEQITHKRDENDILFVIEDELTKRYTNIEFVYVYTHIYSNSFLGLFSKRWKEYSQLKKHIYLNIRGRKVFILPLILLPKKLIIRNWLIRLSLLFYGNRLKKIINEINPSVVHSQTIGSAAYLGNIINYKYNIPHIITLRGIEKQVDKIDIVNINNASKFLAINYLQKEKIMNIKETEACFIPHGISDSFFIKNSSVKNDGYLKLVFIGRLLPLKNVDKVINALRAFSHITLDVIGDGEELNNLEKMTREYDLEERVIFYGRLNQDKIISLLPQYDLFVMPSYPETLGRVYFEAMAAGIPVLASKNTGIDGIIRDGEEGFLIDHGSEEEIKKVFKRITNNPNILEVMAEKSRFFSKQYSWDEVSKKYYDLYFEW